MLCPYRKIIVRSSEKNKYNEKIVDYEYFHNCYEEDCIAFYRTSENKFGCKMLKGEENENKKYN